MPLTDISTNIWKNKLLLQKHFYESNIDDYPYWEFEQMIKEANDIIEEDDKKQKEMEEKQHQDMPSFNPNQYTNGINNMMNKFK